MKTNSFKRISQSLGVMALVTLGSSAMAATTWNFSTCGTSANLTGGANFGNSYSCSGVSGSNKVTVSAYGGANATGSTGFQTAYVSDQGGSGFGIASSYETIGVSAPNHSADNSPTNSTPDMFVLKFDTAVALNAVTLGWNQNDADFTLMAYNGSGSPSILGKKASYAAGGLTNGGSASGWALVQQVGDAAPDPVSTATSNDIVRTVNQGSVVSSWWLISAYSAGYSNASALDTNLDYFKLFSVASKDITPPGNKVPEPGSIALLGLGLVGMFASRRRSQKAA